MFSDKELDPEQVIKLNSIPPQKFRRASWKNSDFKGDNSLYNRISVLISGMMNTVKEIESKIAKFELEIKKSELNNIVIFNTEPYKAEILGMVDVGKVVKFSAPSSGDRFANGAIGYALESVIDDTWTKGTVQEEALNGVKELLLKKAKVIFPNCNRIFKYQVDFRELGSSGNVFVYMRGTAAKGENSDGNQKWNEAISHIEDLKLKVEEKQNEITELRKNRHKIPQDKEGIKRLSLL